MSRNHKKKISVRRVTAPIQSELNSLADLMSTFLPLTSRSRNTVTFTTIFAESRVERYLEGATNKKQALVKGLTEVYRRHEKLLWTIVRKVVPASIEYRRHKRNPLRRKEVDQLAKSLQSLGVDMTRELAGIEIDETLPRVTVPPEKLKESLRGHDLHPALASEPLTLFTDGHFNEAVRKAAERFEDRVRDLSGLDSSGRDLMGKAFSDQTILEITRCKPENQADFKDGYKLMTMGMMAAIRNVFSHGDEERRTPEECFEMFLHINWLLRSLVERPAVPNA